MSIEIKKFFEEITGFKPYEFQEKVMRAVLNNKSVILRAPTGSGKSEAILIPFLYLAHKNLTGKNFPAQMIYSLPIRILVENLGKRFKKYCQKSLKELKVAIHHGENPESELFLEDIVISTIDQTVGAYCCVPLSMSLRSSNIPAGSVSSSFLVFDEVHTFDPDFALQSALILVKRSNYLKIPFAILSATLPDSFLNFFKENFEEIEIVDVSDEKEIKARKSRKIFLKTFFKESLKSFLSKYSLPKNKKVIVVCNTVKRSQEIFEILKKKHNEVFLIHSQFTFEDRKKKEAKIEKIFGESSKAKRGILISTQVIEVGINISCDLMISELSSLDSLIQRAGRISRWGGKGEMLIVGVDKNDKNPYAPYNKQICEKTIQELNKLKFPVKLDWKLEKELVNKVLDKKFKEFLTSEKKGEILVFLSEAAFGGKRKLAEIAVRGKELSCQVAIHDNPKKLGNKVFYLPRINISFYKLKQFVEEVRKKERGKLNFIWEVGEENIIDQFIVKESTKPILNCVEEIEPFKFYIISPNFVKYSSETGLILEKGKTQSFKPLLSLESKTKEKEKILLRRELWSEHSLKILKVFKKELLPKNEFILEKLSLVWQIPFEKLLEYLELAILLHDIGKLNIKWQEKIYEIEKENWDSSKPALAHSSRQELIGIPHSPVSGEIIKNYLLKDNLPRSFLISLVYAIAHHHAPRTYRFEGKFFLIPNLEQELRKIGKKIKSDKIKKSGFVTLYSFPNFSEYKEYRTYAIFSKILRLADRIACERKRI